MYEFEQYVNEVCDYIEERMNVEAQYKCWNDSICVSFTGMADRYYIAFNNISNEYAQRGWRDRPVGAIAQELMRNIRDEWLTLLMRKENM